MRIGIAAAVLLLAGNVAAKTVNVGINGADSGTCGSTMAPCRTVGRAILNASPGDTVLVGPGVYGDANGDRDLSDPGEEGGPCCLVMVNKRITLRSRDGAAVTVLDGGKTADTVIDMVAGASGAIVGGPQNGFTLRHATGSGLGVAAGVTGVHVLGIVAEDNGDRGFAIAGDGAVLTGDRALRNAFAGFGLKSQAVVSGSVAQRNGYGFLVFGVGAVRIDHSISLSNAVDGFAASAGSLELSSGAAIANGGNGIHYYPGAEGRVSGSTILANSLVDATNCGLRNETSQAFDASGNFWGATFGPGDDPGDATCSAGPDSTIDFVPFRKKEIRVTTRPIR